MAAVSFKNVTSKFHVLDRQHVFQVVGDIPSASTLNTRLFARYSDNIHYENVSKKCSYRPVQCIYNFKAMQSDNIRYLLCLTQTVKLITVVFAFAAVPIMLFLCACNRPTEGQR